MTLLLDFRLVRAGYGDLKAVQNLGAREYLQALAFEKFSSDYEAAYWELNKPCP